MMKTRWALLFPVSIISRILFMVTTPVVCLFYTIKSRTDTVKRLNRLVTTMDREYLLPMFYWWSTFDNAADEWWYGMYNVNYEIKTVREWTQTDYDNSWLIRYFCRVAWHLRNCGYGFSQTVLGADPPAWQFKQHVPVGFGYYLDVNIGWKSHKGFTRLMYAGRIFALRKTKGTVNV